MTVLTRDNTPLLEPDELMQIGFRADNTSGYSAAELEQLNHELAQQLHGLDKFSHDWWEVVTAFRDKLAHRP